VEVQHPVTVTKRTRTQNVRQSSKNKVDRSQVRQDEVTAKELRMIAQLQKEESAALCKVQKQIAKQTERDARIAKKAHDQQIMLDQAAAIDDDVDDDAEVITAEKEELRQDGMKVIRSHQRHRWLMARQLSKKSNH